MTYFVALLFTSCAALNSAIAVLTPTAGNSVSGVVSLSSDGSHTYIVGKISGLAASTVHGFHIHAYGNINSTDGTAAGGHYNPYGVAHACPPNSRHVGDLGNVTSDANGIVWLDLVFTQTDVPFNLTIGRAFIVHSGNDDCVTQPTGNAGARLAQGVIGTLSSDVGVSSTENHGIAVLAPVSATSVMGVVDIQTVNGWTTVNGWVSGLPASTSHGFHIHQYGNLNSTDGTAAGGHWNPTNVAHACTPPRHVGDFGNITSDANGLAVFSYTRAESEIAVSTVAGRPFIVHQLADDCTSQPTGAAGARWAQGVIGLAAITPNSMSPTMAPSMAPTSSTTTAPTTMAPTSSTTTAPTTMAPSSSTSMSPTAAGTTKSPTKSSAGHLALGASMAVLLTALLF